MSVLLIAGESVEKISGLTSFACAALQLPGKFVGSSNFYKCFSNRASLKASMTAFCPSSTTAAHHLHCKNQKLLWQALSIILLLHFVRILWGNS